MWFIHKSQVCQNLTLCQPTSLAIGLAFRLWFFRPGGRYLKLGRLCDFFFSKKNNILMQIIVDNLDFTVDYNGFKVPKLQQIANDSQNPKYFRQPVFFLFFCSPGILAWISQLLARWHYFKAFVSVNQRSRQETECSGQVYQGYPNDLSWGQIRGQNRS